jgi:16S rRNA processing protein RimM
LTRFVHKNFVLLKFNNINDINECLEYKGLDIYSERFEDEKIYITDLIGFDAYDEEDNLIGSVVDYLEVPQGYILELETKEGQKVLVPYVDEFIKEIDFENQEIVIHLIEGML